MTNTAPDPQPPRPAPTSARDRIAEERRHEILDAALGVFVRKGINGATMQDIAAEVGLTAGALYRYFPSKEEIVEAVFLNCEEEQVALFAHATSTASSPLEAIFESGRAAWALFDAEDAREHMAMNLETVLGGYRDELGLGRRMSISERHGVVLMTRLVEDAQQVGQLDTSFDARALAVTLLSVHAGLQQFVVQLNGQVDTHAVFEVLSRLLEAARAKGES